VTLLFVTSKSWLGALLAAEMGLFLVYKALRSDFIVWIPGAGYGTSFVSRCVSKLMIDFCSLPQMRNPCDAGGAYWLFSALTNQAVCFMSVWAYAEYYDDPGKVDRTLLYTSLGAVAGTWAVAFVGFLLSIERAYLSSFVSLETGREYAVRIFHETEGDDESRIIHIFGTNERLWESIRAEVKAWVLVSYPRWKAGQAAWLTPGLLAKIPSDFIPKESLVYEPTLLRRHKGVRGLDGDLD
jgi:hypothetical protein